MAANVISVVDINALQGTVSDGARVVDFITSESVGANVVAGSAYTLDPERTLGPFDAGDSFQLFYITDGETVVEYAGDEHKLGVGQGVYCDPRETCTFRNESAAPMKFFRFVVADVQ